VDTRGRGTAAAAAGVRRRGCSRGRGLRQRQGLGHTPPPKSLISRPPPLQHPRPTPLALRPWPTRGKALTKVHNRCKARVTVGGRRPWSAAGVGEAGAAGVGATWGAELVVRPGGKCHRLHKPLPQPPTTTTSPSLTTTNNSSPTLSLLLHRHNMALGVGCPRHLELPRPVHPRPRPRPIIILERVGVWLWEAACLITLQPPHPFPRTKPPG
jgi:hypothetical protein